MEAERLAREAAARKLQAEQVAAAELYKMNASEATAYLSSNSTQTMLLEAGVPQSDINQALAIISESNAGGDDPNTAALGIAGALLVVGIAVAQQQGLIQLGSSVS